MLYKAYAIGNVKIYVQNTAFDLERTSIFEWYMVKCGHKKDMCYNEFWIMLTMEILCSNWSRFNTWYYFVAQHDRLKNKTIFALTSYAFCISTLISRNLVDQSLVSWLLIGWDNSQFDPITKTTPKVMLVWATINSLEPSYFSTHTY